jgi:hypothetical protein
VVPPKALDVNHSVLEDGAKPFHHHPGLVCFGIILLSHISVELGQPQGLLHKREDLVFKQLCVFELVDAHERKKNSSYKC